MPRRSLPRTPSGSRPQPAHSSPRPPRSRPLPANAGGARVQRRPRGAPAAAPPPPWPGKFAVSGSGYSVQSGASGRSRYRRTVVGAHDTAAVTFKLGCALTFVFLACALWEVFLLPPNKAGLTGQGARLYTLSQSRRIPGYWRARGISSKYTPSSPPGPERLIVEHCNRLGSGPWPSPGTEGERERTLLTRHCACDAREAALN